MNVQTPATYVCGVVMLLTSLFGCVGYDIPGGTDETLETQSETTPGSQSDTDGTAAPTVESNDNHADTASAQTPPETPARETFSAHEAQPPQPSSSYLSEHTGTNAEWIALRKTVNQEILKHQQEIQQLKLKIQLIDNIATKLQLSTKTERRADHQLHAHFTIKNPTTYAVKDISITCQQVAPTGAVISTREETMYDIVPPTSDHTVNNIALGASHRQTQAVTCEIKNFTVHQQP